jgi:type II secretion system protein C
MNRLFNDKVLSVIFRILVLTAIAKSIALAAFVFLPKSGVENARGDKDIVNFNAKGPTSLFISSGGRAVSSVQASNLKLMAVYKEANSSEGFAIISDGSAPMVVKSGGAYKQYKLGEIKPDGVYLVDGGSSVWVEFTKSTLSAMTQPPQQNSLLLNRDRVGFARPSTALSNDGQGGESESYSNMIQRSEIQELISNPDNVFKNIGFKEVMKDGKIDGFRVLSINRNSPLAKLGLRQGDIVQSFNGIKLDSYASVLELYGKADSISRVKLEVTRNNEKKEFEYEIY